jgi:hypothetical protein
MALIEQTTLPSDVVADYHHIGSVLSLNWHQDIQRIEVDPDTGEETTTIDRRRGADVEFIEETYINEIARGANKEPVGPDRLIKLELTEVEAAVIKRVLYGAQRRINRPASTPHIEEDDADPVAVALTVTDEELLRLRDTVAQTIIDRGLE